MSTNRKPVVAKLLSFGAGGHMIHATNQTCSGYCSPEDFCALYHWWTHPAGQMSSHWSDYEVPAGGIPCIDKRAAVETPAGRAWAFAGPLVDVDLPDGEAEDCPEPSPFLAAGVAGNAYGSLLGLQAAQRATGAKRCALDSVSIAEYIQGWREHGARIGRAYRNPDGSGRIVWES